MCGPGMPGFVCHPHMRVGSEAAAPVVTGLGFLLSGWTPGIV